MLNRRNKPIDILCAGELLVDMISKDFTETFDDSTTYKCLQGGSPANLCMNMARLGNRSKLAASVGNDDLGNFLENQVAQVGVDTTLIKRAKVPSTMILVTRTKNVANFEAYRGADAIISDTQLSATELQNCRIFHTTCFALSKNPAQRTIYQAAQKAAAMGAQISLDANYASKIWPDQAEAQGLVSGLCSLGAIIKVSEVDWERLYNHPLKDAAAAASHFLKLGASLVCVTMGGDGAWVSSQLEQHFIPSRPIEVKDTTGAGDAFWSGFLTAWLDGHAPLDCAKAGRKVAEMKIVRFGPLPITIDKNLIYSDL